MMVDPGLLQKLPDIAVLSLQGGGDLEQPTAADGTAGALDAKADFALDDRLAQSLLGGVVIGFDFGVIQKDLQDFCALQQLKAGAHGLSPCYLLLYCKNCTNSCCCSPSNSAPIWAVAP